MHYVYLKIGVFKIQSGRVTPKGVHNAHTHTLGMLASGGNIGQNSLPFSLLFSHVQQYFKKQKLFIFVKISPLLSPVHLEGTL
jgi:hypothetical protein